MKAAVYFAELCKGSTTDSDSVCEGSNPSSAANLAPSGALFYEVWLSLVERYVRDVEVAGSNPVTSTMKIAPQSSIHAGCGAFVMSLCFQMKI